MRTAIVAITLASAALGSPALACGDHAPGTEPSARTSLLASGKLGDKVRLRATLVGDQPTSVELRGTTK